MQIGEQAVIRPRSVCKSERWITINGDHDDGGGTHIQIDDSGKIVAGPAGLADKGIRSLSDFGKREKNHAANAASVAANHASAASRNGSERKKPEQLIKDHETAAQAHRTAAIAHEAAENQNVADRHKLLANEHNTAAYNAKKQDVRDDKTPRYLEDMTNEQKAKVSEFDLYNMPRRQLGDTLRSWQKTKKEHLSSINGHLMENGEEMTDADIAKEKQKRTQQLKETGQTKGVTISKGSLTNRYNLRNGKGEMVGHNLTLQKAREYGNDQIERDLEPKKTHSERIALAERTHAGNVRAAAESGLPVPSHVLADYPELAKKAQSQFEQNLESSDAAEHASNAAGKNSDNKTPLEKYDAHQNAADKHLEVAKLHEAAGNQHHAMHHRVLVESHRTAAEEIKRGVIGKKAPNDGPKPVLGGKKFNEDESSRNAREMSHGINDKPEPVKIAGKTPQQVANDHAAIKDKSNREREIHAEPNEAKHFSPKELAKAMTFGNYGFADMLKTKGMYTDGRMLMKMPEKMSEQTLSNYQKERGEVYQGKHPDIAPIMQAAKNNKMPAMREIGHRTLHHEEHLTPNEIKKGKKPKIGTTHETVLADDHGNHSVVNSRYLRTIQKMYPNATFHSPETSKSGIVVKHEGQPVGVVMPLAEHDRHEEKRFGDNARVADYVKRVTGATKPVRKSLIGGLFEKPQPTFKTLKPPAIKTAFLHR